MKKTLVLLILTLLTALISLGQTIYTLRPERCFTVNTKTNKEVEKSINEMKIQDVRVFPKQKVLFESNLYVYDESEDVKEIGHIDYYVYWNPYAERNQTIAIFTNHNLFRFFYRLPQPDVAIYYSYHMTRKSGGSSTPATTTSNSRTTTNLNGHEAVDLGLPSGTKWATCNVGASSPSDYGQYFAWGEIEPKRTYTRDNCCTYNKSGFSSIEGNATYDVAAALWGGGWHMPTKDEVNELISNCTFTSTIKNGIKGFTVKSRINGKIIFLPFGGFYNGNDNQYKGEILYYWTSNASTSDKLEAVYLLFNPNIHSKPITFSHYRWFGMPVRPVRK